MIGAAEQRARPRPARRRRRCDTTRDDLVRADPDVERPAGELVERPPIDVGDQVAEAIDAQHLSVDRDRRRRAAAGYRGGGSAPAGRPSAARSMPLRQPAAAGAKRSRPSNVRLTVGRAYLPLGQLDDALRRLLVEHRRSGRRCRARRTGSRRPRRRCRGAPIRRPDRRRRERSCRPENSDRPRRARARRPGRRAAAMSCEMSTSVASGQMPSTTPFIVPA